MKFRKKPIIVEAMTFEELIEYGKTLGANIVDEMPWSFQINGRAITHENNDCYLIETLEGTMRFNRGEMLIIGVKGEAYPCKMDIFETTYEPTVDDIERKDITAEYNRKQLEIGLCPDCGGETYFCEQGKNQICRQCKTLFFK